MVIKFEEQSCFTPGSSFIHVLSSTAVELTTYETIVCSRSLLSCFDRKLVCFGVLHKVRFFIAWRDCKRISAHFDRSSDV